MKTRKIEHISTDADRSRFGGAGRATIMKTLLILSIVAAMLLPATLVPGQSQEGTPGSTAQGKPKPERLPPPAPPSTDTPAVGQDMTDADLDTPRYPISHFEVQYIHEHPKNPPVGEIMQLPIMLSRTTAGFVLPREGEEQVSITLAEINSQNKSQQYSPLALQRILQSIRNYLNEQQLLGVFVAPDPSQFMLRGGQDLRAGKTGLTILIATATVNDIRTLASGERVGPKGPIKPDERLNNPKHQRIIDNSPIKPTFEGEPDEQRSDLLNKGILDDYLFLKSRHPGRRVDASVTPGTQPGTVGLDYQVTENRPWTIYAQVSNTGTEDTEEWRERFGFYNSQLTDHDDVLSFDYITAGFDATHAVIGSYEAPIIHESDRWRWRVYGDWSQFTASDVGFFNDDFTGESWSLGGEIIWNFYQHREFFLDVLAGARFQNIQVDNEAIFQSGDEDFIVPHVTVRMDKTTEWYSTQGFVGLEWWLSDANTAELETLGRTAPDEDPMVFQGGLSQSVYLEPLFNRKGWEDPLNADDSTLAHEVFGSIRGQYAFDDRLIPQAEQVMGGFYTVRGYPEAAVNGDSMVLGTIEYRYHVPRDFSVEPEPRTLFGQPFRWSPQYVYGRPDWDLILKGFFDAGRTYNSDPFSFESDETLLGAGIGLEFVYRRNLTVRLDWGFALEDVESIGVDSGDNRLHFVLTLLF